MKLSVFIAAIFLLVGCQPAITVRTYTEPVKPGNYESTDMSVIKIENLSVKRDSPAVYVQGTIRNVSNHDVCALRMDFEVLNQSGKFAGTFYDYPASTHCIKSGERVILNRIFTEDEFANASKAQLVSVHWRPMSID